MSVKQVNYSFKRNKKKISYGNLDLAKGLIERKYLPDNVSTYTSIHAACFGNELEILKYLVDDLGLDVNPNSGNNPSSTEQTPLRFAAKSRCMKIIDFLIRRGACITLSVSQSLPEIYMNNLVKFERNGEFKYKTINTDSEIHSNFIFRVFLESGDPTSLFMKKALMLIRYKNLFFLDHLIAEKKKNNFHNTSKKLNALFNILENTNHHEGIKKYL